MHWKNELAYDIRALGSLPFYAIVFVRSLIGDYTLFQDQLIAAIILIFLSHNFVKKTDMYTARAVPLVAFTSLFYNDSLFTTFALILLIGIMYAQYFLKVKQDNIIKGAVIGAIIAAASYFIANAII